MVKQILEESLSNMLDENLIKFQANIENVLYAKVYDAINEARKEVGIKVMSEGPEDPEDEIELTDDELEDLFSDIEDDDYFFDEDEENDDVEEEDIEQIDEISNKETLEKVRNRASGRLMDSGLKDEKAAKVEKNASLRLKKIKDKEDDERSKEGYKAWKEEVAESSINDRFSQNAREMHDRLGGTAFVGPFSRERSRSDSDKHSWRTDKPISRGKFMDKVRDVASVLGVRNAHGTEMTIKSKNPDDGHLKIDHDEQRIVYHRNKLGEEVEQMNEVTEDEADNLISQARSQFPDRKHEIHKHVNELIDSIGSGRGNANESAKKIKEYLKSK